MGIRKNVKVLGKSLTSSKILLATEGELRKLKNCQSFCSQRGGGACMVGGVHGGGACVCGGGACMAGGACVAGGVCMLGGMHGRGDVWWVGACVVGGVCGRGACVAGGLYGR